MGKIVDLANLGKRKKTVSSYEFVKDEKRGKTSIIGAMELVTKQIDEVQPVLNDKEAMLLKDAEWVETTGDNTKVAKFMCKEQGRRFFANLSPANIEREKKEKAIAEKKEKDALMKKLRAEAKKEVMAEMAEKKKAKPKVKPLEIEISDG